jgi:hypothetical protein
MSGFKMWRNIAGADGLQFLTLTRDGDVVTWTRLVDGGGGDPTTVAVWSGLNGWEQWFVTEATFGRQDHRNVETRHALGSDALSTWTWTGPMTSKQANTDRSTVVPLP